MKSLMNKKWVLPVIAGASILVSVAGLARALPLIAQNISGSNVLPPDHPGAQLDPSLRNVPAMPEPNADSNPNSNPKKYPLSPNDPAAQLDPSLLNVPAMPERQVDETQIPGNTPSSGREVEYDVKTGTTRVGERQPANPSSNSTRVSPPNLGADSNIQPEPGQTNSN